MERITDIDVWRIQPHAPEGGAIEGSRKQSIRKRLLLAGLGRQSRWEGTVARARGATTGFTDVLRLFRRIEERTRRASETGNQSVPCLNQAPLSGVNHRIDSKGALLKLTKILESPYWEG